MSVKRFKFVSPGVFLNEIDNSQLPRPPAAVGPTVIGRLEKGPGLIPLTVDSMTQFVEVFGNPMPGGQGGDIWRTGNSSAPTYAAYAAQAFLQNSGPVNVVRLLGVEDPNATTAGAAGWKLDQTLDASDPSSATKSAMYGLYLFSTGGVDDRTSMAGRPNHHAATSTTLTGTLAAVWYMNKGAIILSGAAPALTQVMGIRERAGGNPKRVGTSAITASHALVRATDPAKMEFAAFLYDGTQTEKRVVFNFDRDSDKYVRKVFNTNPTLINADITRTDGLKNYFLGETYDRHVRDNHGQLNSSTKQLHHGALSADDSLCGAILPLHGGGAQTNGFSRQLANQNSCTGWFFSQDLDADGTTYQSANMQKLFRLHGINDGGWNTKYLKVSITDIKAPTDVNPYGSFSVLVRRITDNDARPVVLERFSQCTLDPNSRNYIGRKIGDQYREWDTVDQRYRIYGNFPNQSSFFRVEVQADVDAGVTDPALLPFGFIGPPRYKTGTVESAALKATTNADNGGLGFTLAPTIAPTDVVANFVRTNTWKAFPGHAGAEKNILAGLPANATASLVYPTLPLRISSSAEGLSEDKQAYFGVSTYRTPSNTRFDPSFVDVTRRMPSDFMAAGVKDADDTKTEVSFYFSLDDLVLNHRTSGSANDPVGTIDQAGIAPRDAGTAFYIAGSRRTGLSYTAKRGGYKDLIRAGFTKFTAPVYGGFDGLDITEKEPFRNSKMSGLDEKTSYEIASLKRAVDSVADPEVVEMNTLVAPGITEPRVTNHMIRVCEDRADALAIIDIEKGGYIPSTENKLSFKKRVANASVDEGVNTLEARGLNSSYACCFFPWVKIADTINDAQVWVPPSVTALGTFGSTEARSELWFAPAGFTRGGLSDGAGGLPVLQVSQRLSSKDRDQLYEANVNPIAQFPAEGIVVFGQKTLQVTQSALDRINVRRLMIYVKKEVSRKAATLLFDNNVQATWDRFRGSVEPFLDSVKSRFGLTEFRVVLDETTTTPDLIDRNIMYAKIFLKPARAIEFIAIDFVITNTGASFED